MKRFVQLASTAAVVVLMGRAGVGEDAGRPVAATAARPAVQTEVTTFGTGPLRVAAWNVQTVGAPGSLEYDAALAVLNRISADVVAINEVASDADAVNLDSLAADAGYAHLVVPESNPFGSLRNAFISRFPFVGAPIIHTSADLSGDASANDMTRLVMEIVVDVPSQPTDLTLVVQHWKEGPDDADEFRRAVESFRITQALGGLDSSCDAYLVLGDMNEEIDTVPRTPNPFTTEPTGLPGSFDLGADLETVLTTSGIENNPFSYLSAPGGLTALEALQLDGSDATRPASGRRLDYILASQAVLNEGALAEVYDSADEGISGGLPKSGTPLPPNTSTDASDHFLVFADITIPSCDDGVACTIDTCSGGVCDNSPDHGSCDDGLICTLDTCARAGCANVDTNGATCGPDLRCPAYSDCDLVTGTCVCREGWIPDQLEPGTQTSPPAAPDDCAQGAPGNPAHSVYLHSGEFHYTEVDLAIAGRGLDFVWARKYRSKVGPNTAMGNGWDFSYNVWIEPYGSDLLLHDGNTRRDVYALRSDGTWAADGFFRQLTVDPADGSHVLHFTDDATWRFHAFDNSPQQGKLSAISDRHGNTITYEYDTLGRLTRIHDTMDTTAHDRDVVVAYNGDGLIESVTDWTGRQVQYEYYQAGESGGSPGDLKSATTPAVTGTPNGNDYPAGKTTVYTYSTGFADERLNHNLLTITDPKGQTWLANTYAPTTDPLDPQFDRLIQQAVDDPFELTGITSRPFTAGPGDPPAVIKVTVNDRMGNVSEHFFDDGNRCVMVREYTGRADPDQPTDLDDGQNPPVSPLRANDPPFYETRYEWNEHSLPTRYVLPEIDDEVLVYDTENPDPRKRGDLLQMCRNPGPRGGDQTAICRSFDYHPDFGGCGVHRSFPLTARDAFANPTTYSYDLVGNLTRVVHRIPRVVEDWEYNAFGQITAYVHPDNGSGHRRRDELTYYSSSDGAPYCLLLKDAVADAPGLGLTTHYEYDTLCRVTRIVDPRGNDSLYTYNALDQTVRTQSPEVPTPGGSAVRYVQDSYYDPNDNLVRVCTDNRDETGLLDPDNAYITTVYEYDVLNYLTRTCTEHGSFDVPQSPPQLDCTGLPDSEFVKTEYEYDANNNLTLTRLGEAVNGNQPNNAVLDTYDERDLLFSRVYGPGDAHFGSITFAYDGNGSMTRMDTGLPGPARTWTYEYDGFNRMTRAADPMGNAGAYTYDPNGNVLTLRSEGELVDVVGGNSNVRLSETTYEYDSIDRLTRSVSEHFDSDTQAPIGDGQSEAQYAYSDSSHLLAETDDRGNTTTYAYDSVNRVTRAVDPAGNAATYDYDPNGNVKSITVEDLVIDDGTTQEFTTTYAYDSINRLTLRGDNFGNISRYHWDSHDDVPLYVDPLGAETRYAYDHMHRLTRFVRDMNGDGASDADRDDVVIRYTYDDSSRLRSETDDNGHTTTYEYDSLNRLTLRGHADGTQESYEYDSNHVVTRRVDPNGTEVTYEYDSLNRLTLEGSEFGGGVAPDTTFGRFEYDGLSRIVRAEDDDSVVLRRYDSLSNRTSEEIDGVESTFSYDAMGNRTQVVYPGGRAVEYTYDSLNRITRVVEPSSGASLATYHYAGPDRIHRVEPGNGTQSSFEYDGVTGVPNPPGDFGVGQIIRTRHAAPGGSTIDERTYLWDPLYNKLQRRDLRPGGPQLTHEYEYDPLYRMTKADIIDSLANPVGTTQYDLDGAGNRLSVTGGPDPGTYVLDPTLPEPADFQMNQYTQTPDGARSYDANGNLTGVASASCEIVPPEPIIPDPLGVARNRVVSFRVPSPPATAGNSGTAIRLRLAEVYIDNQEDPDSGCSPRGALPDLSQYEGQVLWLGEPQAFPDEASPPMDDFLASKLQCCPVFRDWTEAALAAEFGAGVDASLVHAYGEIVVPCSVYEVQQVSADCPDLSDESCYSSVVTLDTAQWGDVWEPFGLNNVTDITKLVDKFRGIAFDPGPPPAGAPPKFQAMLRGNSPPFAEKLNVNDITNGIDAFRGLPYAQPGPQTDVPGVLCPAPCPSAAVAAGATDPACISYDYHDRMVEFNDQTTGSVHRYRYDALGRRIAKIVDAFGSPQETRYYYDGWSIIEERDAAGATQATYVYGEHPDDRVQMRRGGQDHYYHTDDLGNVVALTDATGAVVERYEYGDYGAPTITDGSGAPLPQSAVGNPYLFNGRRYDPETGWYEYRTRYLDPQAGRFVTRDAIGNWGDASNLGNAYTYAGNNPWTYVDPLGLQFGNTNTGVQGTLTILDVEGSVHAKKPREIVVVGSKVKDVVREAGAMFLPDGVPIRAKSSVSLAAIAIPNLLDARKSGNESSAIGTLRAVNNAQGLFQYRETDFDFVTRLMKVPGKGGFFDYAVGALMDDRRWRALQTGRVVVRGWDPVDKKPVLGGIRRVRGGATRTKCGDKYFKCNWDDPINFRSAALAGGSVARKRPGRVKYGDITLKRGFVSFEIDGKQIPIISAALAGRANGGMPGVRIEKSEFKWAELSVHPGIDHTVKGEPWKRAQNTQSQINNMISNVQKARHDAMMATIRNIR